LHATILGHVELVGMLGGEPTHEAYRLGWTYGAVLPGGSATSERTPMRPKIKKWPHGPNHSAAVLRRLALG
jgi:hypothetical protein